jgi:antiphage defense system Thoeris ThsA-like protein
MRASRAATDWAQDLLSNGFVGRLLAGVGGIAALLGLLQVIAPVATAKIPRIASPLFLAASAVLLTLLVVYYSRPKRRITYGFRGPSAWNITIKRGDLFPSESGIVVTADRLASTAREVVGDDALVTLLVERWFGGSVADLEMAIGLPSQRVDLLPVGKTLPFTRSGRRGWLLCLAEPTDQGPRTTWQDLHAAYDELWIALRKTNMPRIAVPVIGSGYARAQLSLEGLLHLMLLSYHSASLTGRVAADLEIIVSERDYRPIVLTTAGRLLSALGYRMH